MLEVLFKMNIYVYFTLKTLCVTNFCNLYLVLYKYFQLIVGKKYLMGNIQYNRMVFKSTQVLVVEKYLILELDKYFLNTACNVYL